MTAVSRDVSVSAGLEGAAASVREGIAGLAPQRPVEVTVDDRGAPVRVVRIAVVVPCYNRRPDAEAVLEDLAQVELGGAAWRVDMRILLVDNASDEPLSTVTGSWAGKRPGEGGIWLEHERSPTNSGGSGGYNLGMSRVLGWRERDGWDPEYVWLVDSDARVGPRTLSALLEVMERDESIVGAGSVICDPLTGQAFELGGNQNPRTGHFEPMVLGEVGVVGGEDGLVDCDYVAACCALVRSDAIRATGLFPDRFLNADDVEWFIRMKQVTGGRVVGVPASLAMHPRFDRFPTWTRYYMCRNAFGPLEAVGGGPWSRFVRAKQEVLRAVQQSIMGRTDLAGLHVRALKDAAAHKTLGIAPKGVIDLKPTRPWKSLREDLKRELGGAAKDARGWVLNDLQVGPAAERVIDEQLRAAGVQRTWPTPKRERGVARSILGAAARWVFGPRAEVAVVPARGRPSAWFAGRVMVQGTPQGYVVQRFGRVKPVADALRTLAAGAWQGARCVWREPEFCELPKAGDVVCGATEAAGERTLSLSVVVLSYNRWEALRETVRSLLTDPTVRRLGGDDAVVVVDNGSTDGTPEKLIAEFGGAGVRLIALKQNAGVAAFNRAVEACAGDVVLVLDDDARVERRALAEAMKLLEERKDLAAVTFLPRHPRTGRAEWPFGERDDVGRWTSDEWPVMGCANLVRRADWLAAGGYEERFFLYRNDTDLAMKLLSMGRGVHFDSTWIALHDTAAGAGSRKSTRWHRMATRNWMWVCRRHGRGVQAATAAMMGWAWAHVLAGLSPSRQWATVRGGLEGVTGQAPALPEKVGADGSALRALIALRRGARRHRRA